MNLTYSMPYVRHLHKYRVPVSNQFANTYVALNFGELRIRAVDDMFALELGAVLVETIGNKHRNVIEYTSTRIRWK